MMETIAEGRMNPPVRVLILCTANSARSQMAEGLLRHDGGPAFAVFSAGHRPSSVRPEAVAVMREIGVDISAQRSKHVDEFAGQTFDYVITVCDQAKEVCPVFPGAPRRIHYSIADPAAVTGAEQRLAAFRAARDQLRAALRQFAAAVIVPSPGGADGASANT
jgi:arsenate reductase